MPNDVNQDEQLLLEAQSKGTGATIGAFFKLSGPGYLQSAITLGGGSLAGSLFLGVIGGYSLLWVQLLAMILGVIMLSAISYVTLSTGSSPFQGIRKHINPVLAWGWLIASLAANMIWVLPQYSLAYGAITQNLAPDLVEDPSANGSKFAISLVVLVVVTAITLLYGKKGKGVKIYETILKLMVAAIVLCFVGVVIRLVTSDEGLPLGEIASGFIPNLSLLFNPADTYQAILNQIANSEAREFWTNVVLSAQHERMIAAASAAVGINMTFLLPFSLLAKKWNRNFRGLAIFDLSTGMIVPFIIATSCVVIASASMFHGKPYDGLLVKNEKGQMVLTDKEVKKKGEFNKAMAKRDAYKEGALKTTPPSEQEMAIAAMLIKRDTREFAGALSILVGHKTAHLVFGFGVLAMALSTISLLMLISGFCICEAFGFPHGGIHHKIGTLCGATGILWPVLWTGSSKAYLAIPTSAIGYTLLPIAFLSFIMMMNSKRMLGDHRPKGGKRLLWNLLMGVSLVITGMAAVYTAWGKKMGSFPLGKVMLIGFAIAFVIGHFYAKKNHAFDEPSSPS